MNLIKDPLKENIYYREEALRNAVASKYAIADYWRLAGDAAIQILKQRQGNVILEFSQISFIDQLTSLRKSTQEANHYLKASSLEKESVSWMFSKGEEETSLSCYRYWIAYESVCCSKNLEQEFLQVFKAVKEYQYSIPKAAHYAQEAANLFCRAKESQKLGTQSDSFYQELVAYHWRKAAYTAANLAHIATQEITFQGEKNTFFLKYWDVMVRFTEQVLVLRMYAAEGLSRREKEAMIEYTLAAYAMEQAAENIIKMIKASLSHQEGLILKWYKNPLKVIKIPRSGGEEMRNG